MSYSYDSWNRPTAVTLDARPERDERESTSYADHKGSRSSFTLNETEYKAQNVVDAVTRITYGFGIIQHCAKRRMTMRLPPRPPGPASKGLVFYAPAQSGRLALTCPLLPRAPAKKARARRDSAVSAIGDE